MKEIIRYSEEKCSEKTNVSTCELILSSDEDNVILTGEFIKKYLKKNEEPFVIRFYHMISVNKNTGDFSVDHVFENGKKGLVPMKTSSNIKDNSFYELEKSCKSITDGENRKGFWGVKYKRIITGIYSIIKDQLIQRVPGTYMFSKIYDEKSSNILYEMIVDFNLTSNNIKFHDNVYSHIIFDYPKKKWLKVNDNKILPAILDRYGIKTKYFIAQLSNSDNERIKIKSLAYICKLFGDNYIDYIKKFNWQEACEVSFAYSKFHRCKNDNEKKTILNALIKWSKEENPISSVIYPIHTIFSIRDFLEKKGFNLDIKIKSSYDLNGVSKYYTLLKRQLCSGFGFRYNISEEIINELELPIIISGSTYFVKALLTESDFIMEGIKMKNCMDKQFFHAATFLFFVMSTEKERINLQYQKSNLIQGYAKANTAIPEHFKPPMRILESRLYGFRTLTWNKVKYEIKNIL